MREIFVKRNPLEIQIFVEGSMDLKQIPPAELNLLTSELESKISIYVEKKLNKKDRKNSSKNS